MTDLTGVNVCESPKFKTGRNLRWKSADSKLYYLINDNSILN